MEANREEIYPLTSLRFVAAALVFIEHLQMIPGLEWLGIKGGVLGKIGVTVFFTLSGFVLTYAHGAQNWTESFGRNARDFYWSRFARIYPLHWLMFLIALPLGLNSNTARVSVSDFPWLLTLTDGIWPGFRAGPQPCKVAWTLSVEFVFYFLAPFLFWILCRRKNPLAVLCVLIPIYAAVIVLAKSIHPDLNWGTYLLVPEFLLGIAGFHLSERFNLSRFAPIFVLFGVALLTTAAILDNQNGWKDYHFVGYAPGALVTILGFANMGGRSRALWSNRQLVLLGNASFALYLFHDPVLRYTKVILNRSNISLPALGSVLAGLALFAGTAVGAILIYKLYENPVRLKLRSLLPKASPTVRIGSKGNTPKTSVGQ